MAVRPSAALPTVSITSQVLAHDTGASATDGITSDGTVTLSGKVSGATGTVVRIYDGTKLVIRQRRYLAFGPHRIGGLGWPDKGMRQ